MLTPDEFEALEREWGRINRELAALPTEPSPTCTHTPAVVPAPPGQAGTQPPDGRRAELLARLDEIEFILGEQRLADRRKSCSDRHL
jgi:hypothetical protein